jgi:hypothetical protein
MPDFGAGLDPVLTGWPWLTLPVAALVLVALWRESGPGRWREPSFVMGLLWPMYLVHQFEEHGIDLRGRPFAFLGDLCLTLGHDDLATCPADAAFVFAVNMLACQFVFASTFRWRRSDPLVAAFGWSVPLVNALAHIGGAMRARDYNPGLVTAVLLFLPLGGHMLRVSLRTVLRPREVPMVFGAGIVLHGVLMGSLAARAAGVLPHAGLLAVNALNGAVPWIAAKLVQMRRR